MTSSCSSRGSEGHLPDPCCRTEKGTIDSNAIFSMSSVFDKRDEGRLFLTRTTDRPDHDRGLPFALSVRWLLLRTRDGDTPMLFMNAQCGDGGAPSSSRCGKEGSQIHLHKMEEILRKAPGAAVILTGDFNCHAWSDAYSPFMEHGFFDTFRAARLPDTRESSTFHGMHGCEQFTLEWGETMLWLSSWWGDDGE